jgi:hypothetical protein
MKLIIKAVLLSFLTITFLAVTFLNKAYANDKIHYIGFNAFLEENKGVSGRAFDDYIKNLLPIMKRYGMTFDIYNVVHGGSDDLQADVVTFGSVKNMAVFQKFFQDPDFIAIFPRLHGALSSHQVVFTTSAFEQQQKSSGHTLLSLNWLTGEPTASADKVAQLFNSTVNLFEQYGVNKLVSSTGLMSNKGLAADVEQTAPPHQVELWSIDNAHGFLDNAEVKKMHHNVKKLVQRSEDFWLEKRKI